MRTVEFDLPNGLEFEEEIHKTVVLKEILGNDEILLGKDIRFQELTKKSAKIPADVIFEIENAHKENREPILKGCEFDPIQLKAAEVATTEMNIILFGRLVQSIGSIKNINKTHIGLLNKEDLNTIILQHEILNTPKGGDNKDPLAGEEN